MGVGTHLGSRLGSLTPPRPQNLELDSSHFPPWGVRLNPGGRGRAVQDWMSREQLGEALSKPRTSSGPASPWKQEPTEASGPWDGEVGVGMDGRRARDGSLGGCVSGPGWGAGGASTSEWGWEGAGKAGEGSWADNGQRAVHSPRAARATLSPRCCPCAGPQAGLRWVDLYSGRVPGGSGPCLGKKGEVCRAERLEVSAAQGYPSPLLSKRSRPFWNKNHLSCAEWGGWKMAQPCVHPASERPPQRLGDPLQQ